MQSRPSIIATWASDPAGGWTLRHGVDVLVRVAPPKFGRWNWEAYYRGALFHRGAATGLRRAAFDAMDVVKAHYDKDHMSVVVEGISQVRDAG